MQDRKTRLEFQMAWFKRLLEVDAAFIYTGDDASAKLFQQSTGLTVERFAEQFFLDQPVPGSDVVFMATRPGSEAVTVEAAVTEAVAAMLFYWGLRVSQWRRMYKTMQETRFIEMESFREVGGANQHYVDYTGNDSLVHVFEVGKGEDQFDVVTYCTIRVDKAGVERLGYRLLRCDPPERKTNEVTVKDMSVAMERSERENVVNAESVKSDWERSQQPRPA